VGVVLIPRDEYEQLLADRATLREQLAQQTRVIAHLTDQVGLLGQEVARANDRIAELLAIVQRKQRPGRKPNKAPPPPAHLSQEQKDAYLNRPKPPVLPAKGKSKPKGKPKPRGRKPLPGHLPKEEHHLVPSACNGCGGGDLEMVDDLVEEKLTKVKEHIRRRVVTRKTGRCKSCGTRTTPPSLPAPFARSKATCEFLAWIVHQKFRMLVPLDRIRRDLQEKGVNLSISYLVDQIKRAADLLDPIDGAHWRELLAGSWMATDATGLKVLIPNTRGCHNGYIEVFRRDDLVVFQYEATKEAAPLASKLGPFKGVLVADAEHRHNKVFEDGTVLEAGCNAHGRRKLRDAEAVQPVLAAEGGKFISAIYVAEAEARQKKLTGGELTSWRQTSMAPHRDKFEEWMDRVEPTLLPSDPLRQVISYYRNHWDALFRFIDDGRIPIDNSASEREFQNVAKLRLNALFAGSTEGAHRAAVLLGIVATCRAIGVDSEAYLGWAMTRRGTHAQRYGLSASELTPAAYKRQLAAKG